MDYDVGDWVVCVNDTAMDGQIVSGSKYAVRSMKSIPSGFADNTPSVPTNGFMVVLFGFREGEWMKATRFRKYNPPAPELIQRHTERPKVATE